MSREHDHCRPANTFAISAPVRWNQRWRAASPSGPAGHCCEEAHVYAFKSDGTFDDPSYTLVSTGAKTTHLFSFTGQDFIQGKTFHYPVEAKHPSTGAEVFKSGQVPQP